MRVLFLGKKNDEFCNKALEYCIAKFAEVGFCLGEWGDGLPEKCLKWEGDLIISYLSRWIVPEILIKKATVAAINFHAGSPNYPGFAPVSFALYENSDEFSATCHFMQPKVDTGPIIDTEKLQILPNDDVESLLLRTYIAQYILFERVINRIVQGHQLIPNGESWMRKAFTKKELDKLLIISNDLSKDEVDKRIRALNFRHFKPFIELYGYQFELKEVSKTY